ncbi:Nuclear Receptor Coactivator 1 [Manis pentadactyla]|nr:Nuclear Receptor Coactivator 1 [Manis pentadactyla]
MHICMSIFSFSLFFNCEGNIIYVNKKKTSCCYFGYIQRKISLHTRPSMLSPHKQPLFTVTWISLQK